MSTVKLQVVIPPDRMLCIAIPQDVPTGPAEISIDTPLLKHPAGSYEAVMAALARLSQDTRPDASDEDVDRQIKELRDGWGDD